MNVNEFALIQTGSRTWKQLTRIQGETAWKMGGMAYGNFEQAVADTNYRNESAVWHATIAAQKAQKSQEGTNEATILEEEASMV